MGRAACESLLNGGAGASRRWYALGLQRTRSSRQAHGQNPSCVAYRSIRMSLGIYTWRAARPILLARTRTHGLGTHGLAPTNKEAEQCRPRATAARGPVPASR